MNAEAWAALLLPAIGMVVIAVIVIRAMPAPMPRMKPGLTVLEPWAMRWRCTECGDGGVLASSVPSYRVSDTDRERGAVHACRECGCTNFARPRAGRKIRDAAGTRWEWRPYDPPDDRRKRDPDPVPPAPPSTTAAIIPTSADATVTDNTVTNNAPQGAQV